MLKPRNSAGTVTISGTSTSASVTFSTSEIDTYYIIIPAINATSGSPVIGTPYITSRSTTGFTMNLSSAPGSSASVTVGWHLVRTT